MPAAVPTAPTMKASTTVEATTAAVETATYASAEALSATAVEPATSEAASPKTASGEAATVAPSAAAVVAVSPSAPVAVIPRPGADEHSTSKPAGPIEAVRRAGVRIIIVISIRAHRRPGHIAVSWPISQANTYPHLCL
jgi:hypothetical protein